jgi:hypothetical protein
MAGQKANRKKHSDREPNGASLMPYTLGQAAKAVGRTKATLQEAIKKGRISARKDDLGRYQIDPAELHRVYQPVRPPVVFN